MLHLSGWLWRLVFSQDVQALKRSADEVATGQRSHGRGERHNRQKHVLFNKIKAHFGDLKGKTIALWGLAFKPIPMTCGRRSRVLMESLWSAGAKVRAYDPVAMSECLRFTVSERDLTLCKTSPRCSMARMPSPS